MNTPKRKPTRLRSYDYFACGAYFITICVQDRKELLSKIIVGDGVLDVPINTLTGCGKIADKYINQMNDYYDHIDVENYVIMPNHIHLLLRILECDNHGANGTSRTPSPTNSIIASFVSTFKRFFNKAYGENIWQRSFHDHIIRNEEDYMKIWEYIDTNTIRWELDCFHD